ncbi:Wzz/FepE/Etk N-terminal domain-containing protein [Alsobacter sp. KACC 23698]|uniref:Wzz/FepE/Etk N-terminal domain-containing protein n=1 Tax=Alsobacter sp. KACC 23698 TaxID=3149229 RepID=A0AAU7JJL4_9HYPH
MLLTNPRITGGRALHPEAGADQEVLDLSSLVAFLRRSAPITLMSLLICVGLGLAYIAFIPARYTARTTLLLDVKKPRAVQDQDAIPTNVAELGYIESQVVVLQSSTIMERVVEKLSLTDDGEFNGALESRSAWARICPPQWMACPRPVADDHEARLRSAVDHMRQLVVVQRIGASQVIEINVTMHDKIKAAAIANAMVDSYMDAQSASANRLTREAITWLEQRIEDLRKQALEADRHLQEFKNGNAGPVDPTRRAFMLRELLSTSENQQALYQGFLSRYAQTAQQLSFPLSDVRVLTAATPPTTRSGPSNLALLAISGMSGLLLGLAIAAVRERLDQSIWTADDLERTAGLPCLGAFPPIIASRRSEQARKPRHGVHPVPSGFEPAWMREVLRRPNSDYSRAIGLLLAKFETQMKNSGSAVIGVARIGDDPRQCAIASNLALLAASVGRNVLLVDADCRGAHLTRSFSPNASVGALGVAASAGSIGKVVVRDDATGLAFLPCRPQESGEDTDAPATSPDWIAHVIAQARLIYALVIVDLPGSLESADLYRAVDAIDDLVLVFKAGEVTPALIAEPARALRGFEDHITGLVLTDAGRGRSG